MGQCEDGRNGPSRPAGAAGQEGAQAAKRKRSNRGKKKSTAQRGQAPSASSGVDVAPASLGCLSDLQAPLRLAPPAFIPMAAPVVAAFVAGTSDVQFQSEQKQHQRETSRRGKREAPEPGAQDRRNQRSARPGRKADSRSKDLGEQAEALTADLRSGKYECMVCMERIGKKASVWNCSGCYAIFHIRCITTWSAKSCEEGHSWACPACRYSFTSRPRAGCFCGKVSKPPFDPYLVPHACGEICQRKREGTSCPHPCTAPCHPGPCAPCPAIGPERRCFCSKTTYRLRCGEEDPGKSCDNSCLGELNCKKHFCRSICHPGQCPPCAVDVVQTCYCGKQKHTMKCGTGTSDTMGKGMFSCEQPCNQLLSCGNHVCKEPCHAGPCKPCATGLHLTTCPCGNASLSDLAAAEGLQPRTSCLDAMLTCKGRCGKLKHCGDHVCERECHLGPCGPCNELTKRPCRCGSSVQKVACIQLNPSEEGGDLGEGPMEVTCARRCNVLRECGRHRCPTICCPMLNLGKEAHPCPLPCPKMLSCGVHKCNQGCHKGRCPRCHEASFDELICPCGKTIVYPPILCGTEPPVCNYPCSREHTCSHSVKHNCHFDDECPKCVVLVQRRCAGGHEKLTVQCSMTEPSCGRPCKKALCCGIHMCERTCHAGRCEEELDLPVAGESCGYKCGAELLTCSHPCAAPCHPGKPCPDVQCQAEVYVMCPCRRRVDRGLCLRGGPDAALDETSASGAYVRLECDEQCAVQKRVQQLANAFGRDSRKVSGQPGVAPGTSSEQQRQPTFPTLLVDAASTMPKFLRKVEGAFEELIASTAQEYQFEPMTRIYRQMVVDLADVYNLDAVVVDDEPTRSVIVTRTAQTRAPNERLSDVILRNPLPRLPGTGPGLLPASSKLYALHVFDLNHSVRTEHLEQLLLRPFTGQYLIQWLDDENCVVFFNDEATMQAAMMGSSSTLFKVRPLFDDDGSMFKDSLHALKWRSERQAHLKGKKEPASREAGEDEWPEQSPTSEFVAASDGPSLPLFTTGTEVEDENQSYGSSDVEKIDFASVNLSKEAVPLSENRFAALLKKKVAEQQEEVVDDWTDLLDGSDTVVFKPLGSVSSAVDEKTQESAALPGIELKAETVGKKAGAEEHSDEKKAEEEEHGDDESN